jgi:hypothetical protein
MGQKIDTKHQLIGYECALPGGVDDVRISTFAPVNLRQGDQKGCHAFNRIAAARLNERSPAQLEFSFSRLR